MITQNLKLLTTNDGEQIAIWKVTANTDECCALQAQNILLTHGTFSDKKVCLGIGEYLAKLGHTCYIMEWRGHGASPKPKDKFNFETIATYDIEATFRYLFADLKLDNVHCVTHSGGGICLTMFLIQQLVLQNKEYSHQINSISLFACQAYGAALQPTSYSKILATKSLTRLFGYLPAKKLKLGIVNESYHTMKQWYDWNLQQNFYSHAIKNPDTPSRDTKNSDYLDYRQQMPKITIPIYAISAKGDRFIAPTVGCQRFLRDFHHQANVFREFARAHHDLEDYNHSRIIMSRSAAKEVWSTVAAWIEQHTTV